MVSACRWHARRIIFIILALVCCLTPVLAADGGNSGGCLTLAADDGNSVYSLAADTKSVSSDRSTGSWVAYDYGVVNESTYTQRAIGDNELFWQYTNHSIARGFVNLWNKLDNIYSTTSSINTRLFATNTKLDTVNTSIGSLFSYMWGSASSPITIYRMDTSWDGTFGTQQVNTLADALALGSINTMYAAYWSKLNNDALWSVQSQVDTLNSTVSSASSIAHTDSTALGNKIFDSTAPTGNSAYYHTGVLQYSSVAYPSYLVTTSNGYKVATGADVGTVTSLRDYLDFINRNLIVQSNMIFNFDRSSNPYYQDRYNLNTHSSTQYTVRSLADTLTYGFSDLSNFTGRLASIFASDDDILAREDADPQIQQAQDDFISPDGAASVKLRDLGSAKDVSSSLQGTLDTGVTPATAFSYFGTNGGLFSFFSDDCKYNLDSVPETRSTEEYIDFYTPNFRQIGVAFDG